LTSDVSPHVTSFGTRQAMPLRASGTRQGEASWAPPELDATRMLDLYSPPALARGGHAVTWRIARHPIEAEYAHDERKKLGRWTDPRAPVEDIVTDRKGSLAVIVVSRGKARGLVRLGENRAGYPSFISGNPRRAADGSGPSRRRASHARRVAIAGSRAIRPELSGEQEAARDGRKWRLQGNGTVEILEPRRRSMRDRGRLRNSGDRRISTERRNQLDSDGLRRSFRRSSLATDPVLPRDFEAGNKIPSDQALSRGDGPVLSLKERKDAVEAMNCRDEHPGRVPGLLPAPSRARHRAKGRSG